MIIKSALMVIVGYLLGSISFAYILGRVVGGVDIRKLGSGNVGGMNLMGQVGFLAGAVAGLLDVSKGAAAVLIARRLGFSEPVVLLSGVAAVLGHNYPLFLGFKGGRGGSPSAGVVLILLTKEAAIALAIGALIFFLTRNIAFTLGIAFASLIPLAWWFGRPLLLIFFPLALIVLMGIRILPETVKLFAQAKGLRDLIFGGLILDRKRKG